MPAADKHKPRHFLDLADFTGDDLKAMIADALAMKAARAHGKGHAKPLDGKTVALIFEKPSTRTRVSFEVGVRQLGGDAIVLGGQGFHMTKASAQEGRGESVADTARVLSRYVDMIMIRTGGHGILREVAAHASVPVINGLTDKSHPCQVMADVMTLTEKKGDDLSALKVGWFGDGNNVACSWIEAAAAFGFSLALAVPDARKPDADTVGRAVANGGQITITDDPVEVASGADVLIADTWFSMGDEKSREAGERLLRPYQVNAGLMRHARDDAIFMHCLPAYRGNEVTAEVIDGAQSVVWDEAENRLHVQKAIMAWCMK